MNQDTKNILNYILYLLFCVCLTSSIFIIDNGDLSFLILIGQLIGSVFFIQTTKRY